MKDEIEDKINLYDFQIGLLEDFVKDGAEKGEACYIIDSWERAFELTEKQLEVFYTRLDSFRRVLKDDVLQGIVQQIMFDVQECLNS